MINLLISNFFYRIYKLFVIFGFKTTNNFLISIRYKFKKYNKNTIYFFHMHRSAGTSLNHYFLKINKISKYKIVRFGHSIKPRNVNFSNQNKYIFNLRHPVQLLISSFGQNKFEEINKINKINNKFKSLNSLIECLSSKNKKLKNNAFKAMNSLKSYNYRLSNFIDINFLKKRPPFHIFFYDKLQNDYEKFCKKIFLKKKNKIKVVNKNLKSKKLSKVKLSKLAKRNINNYLAEDIYIFKYIIKNKKKINNIKYSSK